MSENVCSFRLITIHRKDKSPFCSRMRSDQHRCRYSNPAVSVIAGCKYLAAQQASRNFSERMCVCKNAPLETKPCASATCYPEQNGGTWKDNSICDVFYVLL